MSYRLNLPSADEATMLLTVDDFERMAERVQALEHTKKADFEPMVWWCKSAHRDECATSMLKRRKARLCSRKFSRISPENPEFSQFDATMEWCRLWPKRNGGAASTQTSNQTLNRWFGGANRRAETNAQDRCQSAERRVSVPGNSLVYPRRTPQFSQLDATIEWWRLWPKRSGGGGGIRTNGMLCVPLCFFGVFSALQALRNPRQTSSL